MTLPSSKTTLLLVSAVLFLSRVAIRAQALPDQIGVTATQAQGYFLESLTIGGLSASQAVNRAFVALPAAARVMVVRQGIAWARAYVDSPTFKAAYDKRRAEAKPEAPTVNGTVDDELKKKQDEQKQQLAKSRAMLTQLPADQRAQLEAVFKQSEAQMTDPTFVKMMRQGIEMDHARADKEYQSSVANWQRDYPVDAKVLIARRLQAFLALSAGVDFAAKVEGTGTQKRFVNPDYQGKPSDWKMCYRAGKEPVDAARAAVSDWLSVLPKV